MKQNNLGYYVQKINQIVELTENTGEAMNPFFEKIRTAIDENKVMEVTEEDYQLVKESFGLGIKTYADLEKMINNLKAPIKVIGIHKKLERTYADYVESCQIMLDSLGEVSSDLDIEKFNLSEAKQDDVTAGLAFCIQRLSSLLLK